MILVLVTNDDGVDAKGLCALVGALKKEKNIRVIVVAPHKEQSATSHAITLHRPLRFQQLKKDVYAVDGTPIDSVFVGVWVILKQKPDFIFSGINRGGNLGDDIHYSGTVSAAVEGGLLGIPSVALSQIGAEKISYDQSARFAVKLLHQLKKNTLPPGVILNVNIPENADISNFEVTKIGKRDYGGKYFERQDPRGRAYYWIGGDQYRFEDVPGSDCNAIVAGKISITPLQVDMTSHVSLKNIQKWFSKK